MPGGIRCPVGLDARWDQMPGEMRGVGMHGGLRG